MGRNNKVNKHIIPIMTILLIVTSSFAGVSNTIEKSSILILGGNILYVGGSGPGNYSKIQDAIGDAFDGDTVFVFNGTYNESVIVDKTLSIIGENKSSTIIDGTYKEFVIHLIADHIYVHNFTIRNSGGYMHDAGMKLDSENNLITECIFYRTKTGIY